MYSHELNSNMSLPRLLAKQVERFGDKTFIRYNNKSIGYEKLMMLSMIASTRLRLDFGISTGTACALILPNGIDFIQCWFASLFAGLTDVPINHDLKKTSLLFGLQNAEAKVIFCEKEGLASLLNEQVHEYLKFVKLIVIIDSKTLDDLQDQTKSLPIAPKIIYLSELFSGSYSQNIWEEIDGTALASIRYTSGTTGLPKGIMHSHLHMINKATSWNEIMEYGKGDVLYSPFPLHHSLASNNGVIATLLSGGTMAGVARFSASGYWDDIRQEKATIGHILDPMVPMLLKQPENIKDTEHNCRMLWTAWPNNSFERRFRTKLLPIYAMAEIGVIAYTKRKEQDNSRNCGKVVPEMQVKIVDTSDRFLPEGEQGEIVIRPQIPHRIMLGYRGNLDATMRAFHNLWYHTGDEGFINNQGELHFLGRLGDGIRRRGVNISSEQVEFEILQNPKVLECAVIGVPADLGEHDILAFIVWLQVPLDEQLALKELSDFIFERLPKQYAPRFLQGIEILPRTNTGKLQKRLLPLTTSERRWDRENI